MKDAKKILQAMIDMEEAQMAALEDITGRGRGYTIDRRAVRDKPIRKGALEDALKLLSEEEG